MAKGALRFSNQQTGTGLRVSQKYFIALVQASGSNIIRAKLKELTLLELSDSGIVCEHQFLTNTQYKFTAEQHQSLQRLLSEPLILSYHVRFDLALLRPLLDFRLRMISLSHLAELCLSPEHRYIVLEQDINKRALQYCNQWHKMQAAAKDKLGAGIKRLLKLGAVPWYVQEDIAKLPNTCGVYFFYGARNDNLLYVGKSIELRKRVISHFQNDYQSSKEFKLTSQVRHISFIPTAGELGALLLESHLLTSSSP